MSILKDFSFLGRLHSKINFIYSCKVLRLIPVGFKLKWSEQTGFEDPNLIKKVRDTLQLTSLNLLDTVLTNPTIQQNLVTCPVFRQRRS